MGEHPRLSVVVPLYNSRSTLERCIASVLRQTLDDFEVVIVDDGSTDGGGDLARGIKDSRVRVVAQPNRGVSAARNRGVAEARAPLIAFLDADDEWDPGYLAEIARLDAQYPSAGLFVTGFRSAIDGVLFQEIAAALPVRAETALVSFYLHSITEGGFIHPSAAAAPKSVIAAAGGFPEGEPLGEDLDLWVRIAVRYPVACSGRVLATYHSDPGERGRARLSPVPPPPIRTLRRLLAAGAVPPDKARQAVAFVDFKTLEYVHALLGIGKAAEARNLLAQYPPYGWRARLDGAAMTTAALVLPARAVASLRRKPAGLRFRLQNLLFGRERTIRGRFVMRRLLALPAKGLGRAT